MYDLTLSAWLQVACFPEEVSGSEHEGFFLGIDVIKDKLKFMESRFETILNYHNFHHFLFNAHNKLTYASGSLEIEIIEKGMVIRRLVGTATFNILEYDNEKSQNGNYASILKSLCTAQALKEYPQFGSLLNKERLERDIPGKKISKTSQAIKNALNGLP